MFKKLAAFTIPILLILASRNAFSVNLPIGSLPILPAPSASPSDSILTWNTTSGSGNQTLLYDLVNLPPFQAEFVNLVPMTTVGDLIYENATPAPARLGGNTTTTKKFLCGTGTGSAANAPSWCTIASGDVPNNAANTTGTAANLAGAYAIPSPSPSSSGQFAESTGSGIIWNNVPVAGITALTGDVTASGSGSVAATLAATTNATLTTLSALASIDSGVAANKFIASPNGSSGAMTPRSIVSADIPTLNQNTTGTAANLAGIYAIPSPGPSGDVVTATGSGFVMAAAGSTSPLTTKGDIYTYSSTNARQAVPGDGGGLVPDSNQTNGWRSASYTTGLGGRPIKNYIQYSDAENDASTGWALGTIGTLTNGLPTGSPNFSGSTSNLTFGPENGVPLAGSWSWSYSSSVSTTAGNMVATSSIAIDPEDQGKVMRVGFYYQPQTPANGNWSGTSSNSYAWAVYDVTNSVWLSSVGNFCMMQSSGIGKCEGASFQTGATTANIRFVIYNSAATSGSENLIMDDFYVGPQFIPSGFAGTDAVAFTPQTQGFGTISSVQAFSRRVGDSLEEWGTFVSGTTTSVQAQIYFGYNGATSNVVAAPSTKFPTSTQIIGMANRNTANTDEYFAGTVAGQGFFTIGAKTSSLAPLNSQNANTLYSSGDVITFHVMVPITGWSSNTQISADTQSTVTAGAAVGATATVTGSYSNITWTTINNDTNGAFSSASSATGYTIPSTGFYDIIGQAYVSATTIAAGNQFTIGLYNSTGSSTLRETEYVYQGTNTTSEAIPFNYQQVYLNAGTLLNIQIKSNTTSPVITSSSTQNFLSIGKRAGSNAVQAPPTVAFDYYGSTQTITTSAAPLIEPTKQNDSMGLYNTTTGLYPAPYTGTYHCNCGISGTFAAANIMTGQFYVAGTTVGPTHADGPNIAAGTSSISFGDDFPVLGGQTIGCYVNSNVASSSASGNSSFSCHRLGY